MKNEYVATVEEFHAESKDVAFLESLLYKTSEGSIKKRKIGDGDGRIVPKEGGKLDSSGGGVIALGLNYLIQTTNSAYFLIRTFASNLWRKRSLFYW